MKKSLEKALDKIPDEPKTPIPFPCGAKPKTEDDWNNIDIDGEAPPTQIDEQEDCESCKL